MTTKITCTATIVSEDGNRITQDINILTDDPEIIGQVFIDNFNRMFAGCPIVDHDSLPYISPLENACSRESVQTWIDEWIKKYTYPGDCALGKALYCVESAIKAAKMKEDSP